MRIVIYHCILLIFFVVGCEEPLSTTEDNQVVFHTSSNAYSSIDSIQVFLENNTRNNFEIFLRCGRYLEMYYQKKEDSTWSKNLWFSWMSLKCNTAIYIIEEYKSYKFVIPSDQINAKGTYRLILTNDTLIVSNSFVIQ